MQDSDSKTSLFGDSDNSSLSLTSESNNDEASLLLGLKGNSEKKMIGGIDKDSINKDSKKKEMVDMRRISKEERDEIRAKFIDFCISKNWQITNEEIIEYCEKNKVKQAWALNIIKTYKPSNMYDFDKAGDKRKKVTIKGSTVDGIKEPDKKKVKPNSGMPKDSLFSGTRVFRSIELIKEIELLDKKMKEDNTARELKTVEVLEIKKKLKEIEKVLAVHEAEANQLMKDHENNVKKMDSLKKELEKYVPNAFKKD